MYPTIVLGILEMRTLPALGERVWVGISPLVKGRTMHPSEEPMRHQARNHPRGGLSTKWGRGNRYSEWGRRPL